MNKLLIILFSFFIVLNLSAQNEKVHKRDFSEPARWMAGIKGSVGIPYGEFWDKLGREGYGIGGEVHYRIKKDLPIYMGLSLSGFFFDAQTQDYYQNIDGFSVLFRERTRTNIFMGHLQVRIKPDINFFIEPYLDGLFGFKNLYNRTTVEDLEIEEIDIINNSGDWAYSLGGAVGIHFPFLKDGASRGYFDLRLVYLKGTSADYLVRKENGNQSYTNPIDAFERKNSATDMLIPQIGFTFLIGENWNDDDDDDDN